MKRFFEKEFSEEDVKQIIENVTSLNLEKEDEYQICAQILKSPEEMYPGGILTYSSGYSSPFYSWLKQKKEQERDRILKGISVTPSDIQCKGCKMKEVVFYTMQTRRGDEAATTFYICLKCGKRWRD